MRGKVDEDGNGLAGAGITPAYAGKSVFFILNKTIYQGSPPPMRGKVP